MEIGYFYIKELFIDLGMIMILWLIFYNPYLLEKHIQLFNR